MGTMKSNVLAALNGLIQRDPSRNELELNLRTFSSDMLQKLVDNAPTAVQMLRNIRHQEAVLRIADVSKDIIHSRKTFVSQAH
jgi:hypothetical protein